MNYMSAAHTWTLVSLGGNKHPLGCEGSTKSKNCWAHRCHFGSNQNENWCLEEIQYAGAGE